MIHETPVRVRYGEVDRMGVVYHAHYLGYFEAGRTEYLRSLGRTYRAIEEGGMLFVVVDAGLKFLRSGAYDDLLRIRTRLTAVSGVRMRFEYQVERSPDGVLLATGHTTLASTDLEGKPVRLPADFRALLEGLVEPASDASGKNADRAAVQGPTP